MKEVRYKEVANQLLNDITTGTYPEGTLLPTEMELCEHFDVSRHTIRESLRILSENGLIERRKGYGTIVCKKSDVLSHPLSSLEDLVFLARNNLRKIKRVYNIIADIDLSSEIGCEPATEWICISSIRENFKQKNKPICWTNSYARAEFTKLKDLVQKEPNALISDIIFKYYNIKIKEVRQSITAVGVPEEIAGELNVEPNTPALKIIRHYLNNKGEIFETTVSYHPQDRYICNIVLKHVQ